MSEHRITCLVVDDESSLRKALRDVLERSGYGYVPAESGLEALETFEHAEVLLVLSDIRMRFQYERPEECGKAYLKVLSALLSVSPINPIGVDRE